MSSIDFSDKEKLKSIYNFLSKVHNFKSAINSKGEIIENSIKYKQEDVQLKKPTETLNSNKKYTFNKIEYQLSKSLTIENSLNIKLPFVSAEVKNKDSHTASVTNVDKEVYLISSVSVPKIEIVINPLKVELSDEFKSKLNNVQTNGELTKIFQEYGEIFPQRYELGGMITNHETQKFTTIENLESKLFSLSVSVNLGFGPFKCGGDMGKEQSSNEKYSKQSEETNSNKLVIGGDPGKTGPEWASSLSDINNWSIIGVEVFSIMDILKKNDNTLYNKLKKIKNSISITCNVKNFETTTYWESEIFEFQGKKFNITISEVDSFKLRESNLKIVDPEYQRSQMSLFAIFPLFSLRYIFPYLNYLSEESIIAKYDFRFIDEPTDYKLKEFKKGDSFNIYKDGVVTIKNRSTDSFTLVLNITTPDEVSSFVVN